jgi:hypothetical protein
VITVSADAPVPAMMSVRLRSVEILVRPDVTDSQLGAIVRNLMPEDVIPARPGDPQTGWRILAHDGR